MSADTNETERSIKLFSSGRLCLFGEHTDWAGQSRAMNARVMPGRAIVTGIEQGIYAKAHKSKDFVIIDRVGLDRDETNSGLAEKEAAGKELTFRCEMNRAKLREAARAGGYFSYVCGVASYIVEWYNVGGVTIEIYDQTLPMKSGLSSSAAVCVLVAEAFHQLYDLHMNTLGIMNIAYWGEQRTPSRCGRLDQACAFGVTPVSMTFDGHEVDVERIPVRNTLYYVFADLMAGKDTIKILADLNRGYPFASNEMEERLHEALGEDNLDITGRAIEYISAGDAKKLGALMSEAQDLFDRKVAPMSPEQLSSPVLHETLADPYIKELTFGGKGVGSQGDGSVQFLAKDAASRDKLFDYLKNEKGMIAYKLTLKPNSAVRKAIIPVAGFGTRLYPATRGIKKEFCPVIDKDGLVKPVLHVLLEELDRSGIEEICLIINPDEEEFYREYFEKPISVEHYRSLPEHMKKYEDRFRKLAGKVSFVLQREQKGFGHAVYQAASFAGKDPVVLLLGDTIYSSDSDETCVRQLMNAYDTYGRTMVAVGSVPLEDVSSFGMFAGVWEDNTESIMRIDRVYEKPTVDQATDYLGMKKKDEDDESFYGAFGMYILDQAVFDELGDMCKEAQEDPENSEVQLTEALERVMKKDALLGFVPKGRSFDMGNAKAYRKTAAEFA